MKFRRGQAAMEYLMTYGWAILVIVIVLAALLYLGIFNLNPPEVCTMPAGMSCTKSYLSSTGDNVSITLVNGLQKTINVTNFSVTKNPNEYAACTVARCGGTGASMQIGEAHTFTVQPTDENSAVLSFDQGEAFSGKVNLIYYFKDEGAANIRRISGNIYARAG